MGHGRIAASHTDSLALAGRRSHESGARLARRRSAVHSWMALLGSKTMTDLNKNGAKNEVKGAAKEVERKVRAETGKASGNTTEHVKGRVEEAAGKVQKEFGEGERKA